MSTATVILLMSFQKLKIFSGCFSMQMIEIYLKMMLCCPYFFILHLPSHPWDLFSEDCFGVGASKYSREIEHRRALRNFFEWDSLEEPVLFYCLPNHEPHHHHSRERYLSHQTSLTSTADLGFFWIWLDLTNWNWTRFEIIWSDLIWLKSL